MHAARSPAFVILLSALVVGSSAGQTRPPVIVSEKQFCKKCQIAMSTLGHFGNRDDPGMLTNVESVHRDSRGRLIFLSPPGTSVAVFSPTGKFIQYVGAAGSGPGELGRVRYAHLTTNDSLWLFDGRNARVTVFSPEHQYVRSFPFVGSISSAVSLEDGTVWISGRGGSRNTIGYPIHVLSPSGAVVKSFGNETAVERIDMRHLNSRILAMSRDRAIWAAHRQEYVIDKWDTLGRHLLTLRRDADWFTSAAIRRQPKSNERPSPLIVGIFADARQRLWIYTLVADKRWKKALKTVQTHGTTASVIADVETYFDTIVEVIDTGTRSVVASSRIDRVVHQVFPDGIIATVTWDENEVMTYSLWRVDLRSK